MVICETKISAQVNFRHSILLAVIYHPTSSGALENSELYNHIQSNVDSFLCRHPDAVVIVTGDFNPTSTGFNDKHLGPVV